MAYHFHEPLGVVGQIIPWNFPILMAVPPLPATAPARPRSPAAAQQRRHPPRRAAASPAAPPRGQAWKLAPALAAGNCVVLKPAESTPVGILVLMDLVAKILPPGVVNVVTGTGPEAGAPLAESRRIAKVAFTGSTAVGRKVAAAAAANLIPATLELGGKSPNIFFADIMDADDGLFDKALEGFGMFAFNSGEVCTCPSRALVEESIAEAFLKRAVERVNAIKKGNPLDVSVMLGAQNSSLQLARIVGHVETAHKEGAACLTGGKVAKLEGALSCGFYVEPTVFFSKDTSLKIFQDEARAGLGFHSHPPPGAPRRASPPAPRV